MNRLSLPLLLLVVPALHASSENAGAVSQITPVVELTKEQRDAIRYIFYNDKAPLIKPFFKKHPEWINAKARAFSSPLHEAVKTLDVDAVQAVLDVPGMNVNGRNHEGWTPLQNLVYGNQACFSWGEFPEKAWKVLEVLLTRQDVDINVQHEEDGASATVLDDAQDLESYFLNSKGYRDNFAGVVELLKSKGAKTSKELKSTESFSALSLNPQQTPQSLAALDTMSSDERREFLRWSKDEKAPYS